MLGLILQLELRELLHLNALNASFVSGAALCESFSLVKELAGLSFRSVRTS